VFREPVRLLRVQRAIDQNPNARLSQDPNVVGGKAMPPFGFLDLDPFELVERSGRLKFKDKDAPFISPLLCGWVEHDAGPTQQLK